MQPPGCAPPPHGLHRADVAPCGPLYWDVTHLPGWWLPTQAACTGCYCGAHTLHIADDAWTFWTTRLPPCPYAAAANIGQVLNRTYSRCSIPTTCLCLYKRIMPILIYGDRRRRHRMLTWAVATPTLCRPTNSLTSHLLTYASLRLLCLATPGPPASLSTLPGDLAHINCCV